MNKQDGGRAGLTQSVPPSVSVMPREHHRPRPMAPRHPPIGDESRLSPALALLGTQFFFLGRLGEFSCRVCFCLMVFWSLLPFPLPAWFSFHCVCVCDVCVCRLALGCWEHWAEFGFFPFPCFSFIQTHTRMHTERDTTPTPTPPPSCCLMLLMKWATFMN